MTFLESLSASNAAFMRGAREVRYVLPSGQWCKESSNRNPSEVTVLRSLEYTDGSYLWLMDIDGIGVCPMALSETQGLARAFRVLTGILPMRKASGGSGMHLFARTRFKRTTTDDEKRQFLLDLSYSVWKIGNGHVNFGRKPWIEPPYVDTAMYDRRRVVRSYTLHNGTKHYAVPIYDGDTVEALVKRMRGEADFAPVEEIPSFYAKDVSVLYAYDRKGIAKESLMLQPMDEQSAYRGDRLYGMLPRNLQKIVRALNPPYDFRWPVVAWLRIYHGMNTNRIVSWLMENTAWARDWEKTRYQTDWTIRRWVETIEDRYDFPPIPRWVMSTGEEKNDNKTQ